MSTLRLFESFFNEFLSSTKISYYQSMLLMPFSLMREYIGLLSVGVYLTWYLKAYLSVKLFSYNFFLLKSHFCYF